MVYVGVDQHSTQLTVHFIRVDADGVERNSRRFPIHRVEEFIGLLDEQSAVCLEAGSGAFFLAGLIGTTGARVFVVNPTDMRLIWGSPKKTDRVDAKKLAGAIRRHLEADDTDDAFPEVYVPDEKSQELRALVAHYQYLTTSRNRIRNRMFAIFRQRIVQVARKDLSAAIDDLMNHPNLRESDRFMLRQLVMEYEIVNRDYEATKEQIALLGTVRFTREVELLMTIHGVSVFGAVCIMTDIVDIRRFRTRKHLASYLRSAPKVDSSNNHVRIGSINKRGRKLTFTLLLEAAHHLVDGNPILQRYVARSAGKSKKKIRAAVVGKTIGSIFYILRNGEPSRYPRPSSYARKKRQFEKYRQLANAA